MDDKNQVTTASGLNVIAGIWLIIAPFVLGYSIMTAGTNDLILGIVIGVLALIRVFTPFRTGGLSVINAILGIWLIIAPFVLQYTSSVALYNDIILGIVVLALAAWSASASAHHQRAIHV